MLLDEPTTGVDPISRRFLWKSIQDFQSRDKTIVLTSHRYLQKCFLQIYILYVTQFYIDYIFLCFSSALKEKRYTMGLSFSFNAQKSDKPNTVLPDFRATEQR